MAKANWSAESRHKRGYGVAWDRLRRVILKRDNNLCQCDHCKAEGRTTIATEVDHIISRARATAMGWSESRIEDEANLQAINSDCHTRKTIEEQGKRVRTRTRIGLDGFPIT